MPTSKDFILVHDFHGAGARVRADETAFPLREDHFMIQITAHWGNAEFENGRKGRLWAEGLREILSAIAMPGGYPALLAPDEHERVRAFYSDAAERLTRIKGEVDPNDVFRSAIGRLST